jgi:starch phosphorylase
MTTDSSVACFSMEIALEPSMPAHSGGPGVLAGDIACCRRSRPADGWGYARTPPRLFRPARGRTGTSLRVQRSGKPEELLEPMTPVASVNIEGREVRLRAWRYRQKHRRARNPGLPVDTALPENSPWDRGLTDRVWRGCALSSLPGGRPGNGRMAIFTHLGHLDISVIT